MVTVPGGELFRVKAVNHIEIGVMRERIADDPVVPALYGDEAVPEPDGQRSQPFQRRVVIEDNHGGDGYGAPASFRATVIFG
jgi:hypothetical protein